MKYQSSTLYLLAATTAATPLTTGNDYTNGTNSTTPNSFKEIPLTKDIQWTPCFGQNFTCVNLEVPLDYEDDAAGTTNIAFLKWSSPEQPAMGDLIFNPGGPGDSAVSFLLEETTRSMLTGLFGTSYNIIGMDPRGINNSGPDTECYKNQPALRDYAQAQRTREFDPASPVLMKSAFQEAGAFGDWCSRALDQTANYANTPATARDLLYFTELNAEEQGKPREEAKLDYYGASYGTTLGMTFAQLYPERVGHFMIDAVVDLDDCE